MPPKFSTVVNATGFAILVKGQSNAVLDALVNASKRLERVSGLTSWEVDYAIEQLPRTGDNIRMRVTWQANART